MSSVDEHSRHELYLALEEVLGPERTATLMSLLPPVGWADVATKTDLRGLEERMDLRFEALEHRFEALEHKLRGDLHAALREQTRTMMIGMIASLGTMASLCLGAVSFLR